MSLWILYAPAQVCWPWSRPEAAEPGANTALLALGCPEPERGAIRPSKPYGFRVCVQAKKQYSQAFSFFDLPKPIDVIGFQTKKKYSQVCYFFDLPKPVVFIGFQPQN